MKTILYIFLLLSLYFAGCSGYSDNYYVKQRERPQEMAVAENPAPVSTPAPVSAPVSTSPADTPVSSHSATVATPPTVSQFRALIIANSDYEDSTGAWAKLKTPLADARALKQTLIENYGYPAANVTYVENATREKIYEVFKNLLSCVQPDDYVFIFYGGHGYFDPNTGTSYWIPKDAVGTNDASFVDSAVIRTRVAHLSTKCKHILLVSDSCFSGDLLNPSRGIKLVEKEERDGYFVKRSTPKSCQVITSGGKEYVDDEYKNSGHSPFAYFFIRALTANTEKYLSATELAVHMEKTVSNAVGQTPKHGILKTAEDEGGEFFFIRK